MSRADAVQIGSPLPRHFMTRDPGVGGVIKLRPEDFLVDELPLYESGGEGEHLYLRIEKAGVSHAELMSCLRSHFGVPESAVGYAGMKDKIGVTRQTVSIHLPGRSPPDRPFEHERIRILWTDRHTNKLRRGHLAGNRFSIRLREVDPLQAPRVRRMLQSLERTGVPNYFGPQRFGYRTNNHLLGAALMHGRGEALLDELLGTTGSSYPPHQRERREHYEAGAYDDALRQWAAADGAERAALRALARGMPKADAWRAIRNVALRFWISALQSAIFNRVLDRRIEGETLAEVHRGDVMRKHENRAVFAVRAEDLEDTALRDRLQRLEISPTGPLWGGGMKRAEGEVDAVELEALHAVGLTPESLAECPMCPEGDRRALRERVSNGAVDSGFDEHGPFIRVAFDLPRGTYATIVLREIMKNVQSDSDDGDSDD